MKRLLTLATLSLLAACGGGHSANALSIATTFSPDPMRQGTETLTVHLQDANAQAVKGAVVKVTTTMPMMSMSGPSVVAVDKGDGAYTATFVVQYATKWVFAITATQGDKTASATVNRDAK
ncbi:MAG TPA: FixH family protein [Verrucomicrobiae bacterium]|jgi:nitrogen fixation protein FixH|nr:FixH family protein [Verrucomicrobiae bacterium]